mmetsp:Transcript_92462/g.193286  ORF Transcript_92462/g.193286 Transcript_92462/m.193286 type:complete len:378 (-) Transcript_92462:21-1154(-)
MSLQEDEAAAWMQELQRRFPSASKDDVIAYLRHLDLHNEYPMVFFAPRLPILQDPEVPVAVQQGEEKEEKEDEKELQAFRVRCHCDLASFQVSPTREAAGRLYRCHCPPCRRYHTSAWATYLRVATPSPLLLETVLGEWGLARSNVLVHQDQCLELGAVQRICCRRCMTKLATLPSDDDDDDDEDEVRPYFIALGSVEDSSIPPAVGLGWRSSFEDWSPATQSRWWLAKLTSRENLLALNAREVSGGCSCGSCRFVAAICLGQLQHCYCNLCRRMSGSASMTWIPASNEGFRWTSREGLIYLDTTRHGQRGFCRHCGCCLAIVYHSQPDCTWPVAGALDDDSVKEQLWCRIIHICCSMMQNWFSLPDDGYPRLKYAG